MEQDIKLMFISDYIYTTGGSHENSSMHLKCLRAVLGEENVLCVALTAGKKIDINDGNIHLQGYSSKLQQLDNLLKLNDYCLNHAIEVEVCDMIEKHHINCVFMNCTMGKLAKAIKHCYPQIVIMSFYHDIKAVLLSEWLREKGLKALPLCVSGKYNEKQMQKYGDIHITLNRRDATLYKRIYGRNPDFELPIVLKDGFRSGFGVEGNNEVFEILFAGVYYYPNVQGIIWFCNEVLPKITDSVQLNIVGLNMEKLDGHFSDPRINIVGTVDSLIPWYERADLVIAPIFKGGGMKIKTAEAMMYGKQFVGTSESMEGYSELIPDNIIGKYIFEVNDIEGFCNAVHIAYENRRICSKFIPEVRELFNKYYSEQAGYSRFEKLMSIAVEKLQ